MKRILQIIVSLLFLFILASLASKVASAHCDSLEGPVVKSARKALETENVNYALIWVKPEDEDAVRKALKKARDKRKKAKSKAEKDRADMEFFEALVRIHREGEGAKYEGLKPADSIEPEITLADKAVEKGEVDEVLRKISSEQAKEIIRHLFHKVREKADYDIDDLYSGREFVETYVQFIHTVESALKGHGIPSENHH